MRIWSWQHFSVNISWIHYWVEPSLLLSSFDVLTWNINSHGVVLKWPRCTLERNVIVFCCSLNCTLLPITVKCHLFKKQNLYAQDYFWQIQAKQISVYYRPVTGKIPTFTLTMSLSWSEQLDNFHQISIKSGQSTSVNKVRLGELCKLRERLQNILYRC